MSDDDGRCEYECNAWGHRSDCGCPCHDEGTSE